MPFAGPETALASTIDSGSEESSKPRIFLRPAPSCAFLRAPTIFQSLARRLNHLHRKSMTYSRDAPRQGRTRCPPHTIVLPTHPAEGGCPHIEPLTSTIAEHRGDRLYFVHWSTQSFTVLYQSCEFCGFSTQWPSSGKYSIFEGTPSICSVVNSWKPSLTSRR